MTVSVDPCMLDPFSPNELYLLPWSKTIHSEQGFVQDSLVWVRGSWHISVQNEGEGEGKEREAATQLIKNSKLTHAGHVTKINTDAVDANHAQATRYVLLNTQLHIASDRPRWCWGSQWACCLSLLLDCSTSGDCTRQQQSVSTAVPPWSEQVQFT